MTFIHHKFTQCSSDLSHLKHLLCLVEKALSLASEKNERQLFRKSSGEEVITTTKTAAFSDAYFNTLTF